MSVFLACRSSTRDISLAQRREALENNGPSMLLLFRLLVGLKWCDDVNRVAPATTGSTTRSAPVFRMSFGAGVNYGMRPCFARDSGKNRRTNIEKVLLSFIERTLPEAKWTSMAIAYGAESGLHIDHPNVADTWVIGLGPASGGKLWVSDGSCNGVERSTRHKWLKFDAQCPHCTGDFEGERLTITLYSHRAIKHCSSGLRASLVSRGFPLPTKRALEAAISELSSIPTRAVRMRIATTARRRFLGQGHAESTRTQQNRAPGTHRAHAWSCQNVNCPHGAPKGIQKSGKPRKYCCRACGRAARGD